MKPLIITLLVATILGTPATVKAEQLPAKQIDPFLLKIIPGRDVSKNLFMPPALPAETIEIKKPEPKVHTVVAGDNLSKIGTAFNVEWQRLWAKNTQLNNPDLLHVGDKITIPEPSEQLSRELPVIVALPAETPNVAPQRVFGGGNSYDVGYCTWYVKNRRGASIPDNLGNANTWYSRAAAAGLSVGSIPKPGAVGTTTRGQYGHVVYVESVNPDGSINISEMNYKGWNKVSSRTTQASEFLYIY